MKPLKKVLLSLTLALFTITLIPAVHDVDQNDLHWLSLNIYYEAGNQPTLGKIAVGVVTINRVRHQLFPGTIESVIKERKQFSWYNNKKKVVVPNQNDKAWKESIIIARYVLKLPKNHAIIDPLRNVTHYHATYVRPKWKNSMIKVAQIGDHIFYRMREKT
jgi:spore germination cell wall hydrolase CwlJ-like protein